jgi:hypothetical protein
MTNDDMAVVESDDTLALRIMLLAEGKKVLAEHEAEARTELFSRMKPSQRHIVMNPLDDEQILGALTKTKPSKAAEVTGRDEYASWVEEVYPEACDKEYVLGENRAKEIVNLLYKLKRFDLLDEVVKVDPAFTSTILQKSTAAGVPVGPNDEADVPGIEMRATTSKLQYRAEQCARNAFFDVVATDRAAFGGLILPGIEAAA